MLGTCRMSTKSNSHDGNGVGVESTVPSGLQSINSTQFVNRERPLGAVNRPPELHCPTGQSQGSIWARPAPQAEHRMRNALTRPLLPRQPWTRSSWPSEKANWWNNQFSAPLSQGQALFPPSCLQTVFLCWTSFSTFCWLLASSSSTVQSRKAWYLLAT